MIIIKSRNTVQKTLILNTVRSMKNHPTADEIYEAVCNLCPGISKGTVYRDLNRLALSGEIRRVAMANAPDRYDLTAYNHAHCRCSVCGKVYDYRLKVEPELDTDGTENFDFEADSIDVVVHGVCKICKDTDMSAESC